jgi:hypothetical protein
MLHDRLIPLVLRRLLFLFSRLPEQVALPILDRFLESAFLPTVVFDTPLGGALLAVDFTATKGTAQIVPTRVTGMCQKEYSAVPAVFQAASTVRMAAQGRAYCRIILQNKVAYLALAIPVRPELKMSLDLYCKKPRLPPTILMGVCMSSFYSINAFASSGRTGTPHQYHANGSVLLSRPGSIPVSAIGLWESACLTRRI